MAAISSAAVQEWVSKALAHALGDLGVADSKIHVLRNGVDMTWAEANYGHIGLDEALQVAEPALEKALDLDHRLGAAYASIGLMRNLKGDRQGAASALSRAIALDPNDAKAYHWYGDMLIYISGDPVAAIPVLQQARQPDRPTTTQTRRLKQAPPAL